MPDPLSLLQQRRSAPAKQLGEPAPTAEEWRQLLEAAIRVPDHGKLVPFRLIELRGEAKRGFGDILARRVVERYPDLPESKRDKERRRYSFAPLVLVVVASIDRTSNVPELEQTLTAGCVAHNVLLGACALGYGAQWLTGWAAYDDAVARLLGLGEHEKVIGFIHIGTPQIDTPDRDRPALDQVLSRFEA